MTGYSYPKIVDTVHYHLWTDALHARALAHQANNKWDRGTYVRWAVISAWTALEQACEDALQVRGIGKSFEKNLNTALQERCFDPIDRGRGTWQKVAIFQSLRIQYVHVTPSQEALLPAATVADEAIDSIREAIKDIYTRTGSQPPPWVEDDEDIGWDKGRGTWTQTIYQAGADPDSQDTIRVGWVYKDREYIREVWPAGTDPEPVIEDLRRSLRVPVSRIRAYRGDELIVDRKVPMRGA